MKEAKISTISLLLDIKDLLKEHNERLDTIEKRLKSMDEYIYYIENMMENSENI